VNDLGAYDWAANRLAVVEGWPSGRIADIPLAGEGEQSGLLGVHMAEGLVQFTMWWSPAWLFQLP
jgi:hypothetical protein